MQCTYFALNNSKLTTYFSFQNLKEFLRCLPACIVSNEKSTIIFIFVSLCIMAFFPLTTFKIFSFITGVKQFDYDVSWSSVLYISCVWDSLNSQIRGFIVPIKLGSFSAIVSSTVSSVPRSKCIYVRMLEVVPQLTVHFFQPFLFFFFFRVLMQHIFLIFQSLTFPLQNCIY